MIAVVPVVTGRAGNISCGRALLGWFVAVAILAPAADPSPACVICVPYPEQTLADRLLAQDEIMFARELPDSPYVFRPVEIIRGRPVEKPV